MFNDIANTCFNKATVVSLGRQCLLFATENRKPECSHAPSQDLRLDALTCFWSPLVDVDLPRCRRTVFRWYKASHEPSTHCSISPFAFYLQPGEGGYTFPLSRCRIDVISLIPSSRLCGWSIRCVRAARCRKVVSPCLKLHPKCIRDIFIGGIYPFYPLQRQ